MKPLIVVCVDDEREILASLAKDLDELNTIIHLELCESGQEAIDVLRENNESPIALLISDHLMPDITGAVLFHELQHIPNLKHMKVLMLTGHATHKDTIDAINSKCLHAFINKPWDKKHLIQTVRSLLTDYVIETRMNIIPFMKDLDSVKLLGESIKQSNLPTE